MHGADAPVWPTKGLRVVDGALRQARRAVDDVVFTPQVRGQRMQFATKRHGREKSSDRAVRQLVIGIMDPAPLPRLCSAYSYWQVTRATTAVMPIFENSLASGDHEESEVAAHCVALMGKPGAAALRDYFPSNSFRSSIRSGTHSSVPAALM